MPTVTFGSLPAANSARDSIGQYLAVADDRRTKTIKLEASTPRRIVERLENEAFGSQSGDRPSTEQAALGKSERESLKRQHRTFSWQQHGFEAMHVKGALKARGVDTWQDFYEPGEGVESALSKLQRKKGQAGQGQRASLGIESKRTDMEEESGGRRRRRQAERVQAQQIEGAKEAAILESDPDAIGAVEEERLFSENVFDIAFSEADEFGRPIPSGGDAELVEERHESRSEWAQRTDERRAAPITRDPLKWAEAPAQHDFPGVDTVDPEKVHEARSERAKTTDGSRGVPIAGSETLWDEDIEPGGILSVWRDA